MPTIASYKDKVYDIGGNGGAYELKAFATRIEIVSLPMFTQVPPA